MGLCCTNIAVVTVSSGSRPHVAPWLGGTPPFGAFIISIFVAALIYISLTYNLTRSPLTNCITGTSYPIAQRLHHERANSLVETLY